MCNIRGVKQALNDFPEIEKFLLVGESQVINTALTDLNRARASG